ncbi:Carboxypeptidase S1 [Psilocybe cubensis]|uniref:Carboxypeptidase S1 n=2 Tax=Psilocybe cubensis TaxID=181762 RepID=A0ACB8GWZ4_PSICU|nr:Carboxypeptidase S1 [Psilocybe cubensis]KAH9480091.1 Carboxypeptidase S1 [Psilocybe cubensis]
MHNIAFTSLSALLSIGSAFGGQIPGFGDFQRGISAAQRPKEFIASGTPVISNVTTPGKLRVVENSGICETTPGVYQASGYGDISASDSIWFWFFESRKNPKNAPLALWFNGGPGSSSMIGLFQEHGPCRITNDSLSVAHNPFSWNNEANVLYIDQPIGTGFSYGDATVGTSQEAAADVWSFLQIFLTDKRFSHLKTNKLALWAESYGGHYAPVFAAHFLKQNEKILAGKASGTILNLQVLGIGDGITNPLVQYPGYLQYSAFNPYHYPLVDESVLAAANDSWNEPGTGCRDMLIACNGPNGTNTICSAAQDVCNDNILYPLVGVFDPYYIPSLWPDSYPPPLEEYINDIAPTIGGLVPWIQNSEFVYTNFAATGDWMRNSSPDLEFVINSGVRTIIYDGDADYILNFNGVEAMVDDLKTIWSPIYKTQKFKTFSVRGEETGIYKNAGRFSYVRIFGAGHEVPAYKYGNLDYGEAAAQMFTQIMRDESLSST